MWRITDSGLPDAMARVECAGWGAADIAAWKKDQADGSHLTVAAARAAWRRELRALVESVAGGCRVPDVVEQEAELLVLVERVGAATVQGGCVYGIGGWTRWFTRLSGEVVFSRSHAGEIHRDKLAAAEAAGFRIA